MKLIAVLKSIGKGLEHAAPWVDEGLKIACEVAGVVDPPLAPIFDGLDKLFEQITQARAPGTIPNISADNVQNLIKAFVALHVINNQAVQK